MPALLGRTSTLALLLLGLLACDEPQPPPPPPVTPGVVAADHPLASEAGAAMLRAGGNAVDAAVAAALAGGVVQPHSSGLGGGGFAVMVLPGGEMAALDFRERAPAAATPDMYLDEQGAVVPGLSDHGATSVAVPGEPRGLATLLAQRGSLSHVVVAAPAIHLARDGFPVGAALARASVAWSEAYDDDIFPLLFDDLQGPPFEGQRVRRSALADTLQAWADTRGEALYTGPQAAAVVEALADRGGLITAGDLAAYTPVVRQPLVGQYRDWTIVTMPPPSSGGLVILQVLGVLEAWPPAALGPTEPSALQRTVEALKHAFADRAHWMGDPDFVKVPVDDLLADARIEAMRTAVTGTGLPPSCATLPTDAYGLPTAASEDQGTHHISVLDANGVAVALTTTINTTFGSGVVEPTTGLLLNDEMDDFVAAPGVPNFYGLVGNERNAIAPGKRPLSSMSPTVVLDAAGAPMLVVGASGGPRIITGTLQVMLALLEGGATPADALAQPRFHHQWLPDQVRVESGFPDTSRQALEACGHKVDGPPPASAVQLVMRRLDGTLIGGSDPRKGGLPVTVE